MPVSTLHIFGDTKGDDSLIFCAFCGENQVKSVLATKKEQTIFKTVTECKGNLWNILLKSNWSYEDFTGLVRRILDGSKCTFCFFIERT